jgi:hypothetical protein
VTLRGHDLPGDARRFVLTQDGTKPIALTDSHGTWIEWLS